MPRHDVLISSRRSLAIAEGLSPRQAGPAITADDCEATVATHQRTYARRAVCLLDDVEETPN
jgi:hypothetical protein